MLGKLRPGSIYDVCAATALFVALGGTAYAVNTVGSSDIVDGQVKAVDVGDGEIGSADVKDGSLNTFDVHSFLGADVVDGTLTGADVQNESIGAVDIGSQQVGPDEVQNDSLLQSDIRAGAVTSDEVLDNTLTGVDINESTLNLPQERTIATFAGVPAPVSISDTMTKVASKNVPAGSYAILATMNHFSAFPFAGDQNGDTVCELRNGSGFIGGASDRRTVPDDDHSEMSLAMNGGAQVPAGGGEISTWCRSQVANRIESGQMLIIRLDGFF